MLSIPGRLSAGRGRKRLATIPGVVPSLLALPADASSATVARMSLRMPGRTRLAVGCGRASGAVLAPCRWATLMTPPFAEGPPKTTVALSASTFHAELHSRESALASTSEHYSPPLLKDAGGFPWLAGANPPLKMGLIMPQATNSKPLLVLEGVKKYFPVTGGFLRHQRAPSERWTALTSPSPAVKPWGWWVRAGAAKPHWGGSSCGWRNRAPEESILTGRISLSLHRRQ